MKIEIAPLFRDPQLKAIFEKAERDQGQTPAVIDRTPKRPRLNNGAAAPIRRRAVEFA